MTTAWVLIMLGFNSVSSTNDLYANHKPDHFERLDKTIEFVTQHGYEPVFFHEGFLGGRDWEEASDLS